MAKEEDKEARDDEENDREDEEASAEDEDEADETSEETDEESTDEEDEGDEEDDEDEEEEEDVAAAGPASHRPPPPEPEDPNWWAPHAVLGALVLVGVLGFFGVWNRVLTGIIPAAADPNAAPPATSTDTKPAMPTTTPMPPRPTPGPPTTANAESYGAKHLLVMYKGGMRAPAEVTRSKDEAKTRAEEALKEAKAPNAKFEDVVAKYSDEPGAAQRGGNLGKFKKGAMVPEFQAAVEKLKVGEISGLVETAFGYHVILRTE